jgi:hypothetical protein
MKIKIVAAILAILFGSNVEAQSVRAERVTLTTGNCTMSSGTGTPESAVTGKVCDTFWRSDTGTLYIKISGTGNTGWVVLTMGSGTTNTVAKWTSATALGNSSITDASDIVLDPVGNDVLPANNFDVSLGSTDKKFLTVWASELWVETLVAQQTLATIGGRVLVSPTNILARDAAPGDTTIYVKYNSFKLQGGGEAGSKIVMESNGKYEIMHVTTTVAPSVQPDGSFAYVVVRNDDGTGANQWYSGDAILDTGKVGDGFIDLYSLRGIKSATEVGPTIVGNVRYGANFNEWEPRWAIGNLNGLYGYSSDTYGTAFGAPTAAWVKIDTANGVRLGYNATTTIQMSAAGVLTLGPWTLNTDGFFRDTGTAATSSGMVPADIAYYAGATLVNRGTAPFRVTASGALTATSATITGSITATSGNVSGAITAGSITTTMLAAGAVTAAKITAGTITATEIAANTITAAKIAAGTITTTEIAANTITAADIAAGTITATEIASNTITASNIAAGTITATEIAASTITAAKLNVATLSAITANLGTVTAGSIVVGSSNQLWLNDSGDGELHIGGTDKANSPFWVAYDGTQMRVGTNMTAPQLFISGTGAGSFTRIEKLGGTGNASVCTDNLGYLYRGSPGC